MKSLGLGRYALSSWVGAALLAGCGALRQAQDDTQPPIGAPGAMPQSRAIAARAEHGKSWMLSEAKSENLIYVAGVYNVFIFNVRGKEVGSIDFLADPGVCSDANGNVWVTSGGATEYSHGSTTPIRQLNPPYTYQFVSCSVDPLNGDIALTMSRADNTGGVAVFQKASGAPQIYTDPDFRYYVYCTYDSSGDLFVNGLFGKKPVILGELPARGSSLVTIALNSSIEGLGGLQWDGQYLALGDRRRLTVYQVDVSSGEGTIVGSTHFTGWREGGVDFWINRSKIGFVAYRHFFGIWEYPIGGHTVVRFPFHYATPGGTAFSIAPQH